MTSFWLVVSLATSFINIQTPLKPVCHAAFNLDIMGEIVSVCESQSHKMSGINHSPMPYSRQRSRPASFFGNTPNLGLLP